MKLNPGKLSTHLQAGNADSRIPAELINVNAAPSGGGGSSTITDWYWVVYDSNGNIVSAEYMYSTYSDPFGNIIGAGVGSTTLNTPSNTTIDPQQPSTKY